jgi:hypothetical protein
MPKRAHPKSYCGPVVPDNLRLYDPGIAYYCAPYGRGTAVHPYLALDDDRAIRVRSGPAWIEFALSKRIFARPEVVSLVRDPAPLLE